MPAPHDGRMSKDYLSSILRTAAFVFVLVFGLAAAAPAQTIDTNIFDGTNAPNPDSISVSSLLSITNQVTGPLGPGYIGTVSIGVGLGSTLTESINAGGDGALTVVQSGVLGASSTFSATKTFADATFTPMQRYRFTLVAANNGMLNLLSSADVLLSITSNGVTTSVLDTSTGAGLLGAVNLLNLFGSGNTAAIDFQAPATVDPTASITVTVEGGFLASGFGSPDKSTHALVGTNATGSTFSFTGASLQAVPEPGPAATLCLGALGAAVAFRRRLA